MSLASGASHPGWKVSRRLPSTVDDWRGRLLLDRRGQMIGRIAEAYRNSQTDAPSWVMVHTGFFGIRKAVVPVGEAALVGEDILVPYDKDAVKDAPRVEIADVLSSAVEDELTRYYGLRDSTARTNSAATDADNPVVPLRPASLRKRVRSRRWDLG